MTLEFLKTHFLLWRYQHFHFQFDDVIYSNMIQAIKYTPKVLLEYDQT